MNRRQPPTSRFPPRSHGLAEGFADSRVKFTPTRGIRVRIYALDRGWDLIRYYLSMAYFSVSPPLNGIFPIVKLCVRAMIASYDTDGRIIVGGYNSLPHCNANVENICALYLEHPMTYPMACPLPETFLIGYTGEPHPFLWREN